MARLIVKSPYIKCGGNQGADGYMRYIATRERVEIIPDDRPPTRKQEQLITKLTKDFPDVKELLEYDDYVQKPTKANASSLITLALEEHWKQVQQTDGYMKYIATRPRAERLGDHGLFGDADRVDLDTAISELEHYCCKTPDVRRPARCSGRSCHVRLLLLLCSAPQYPQRRPFQRP